jgi:hypothetical protein
VWLIAAAACGCLNSVIRIVRAAADVLRLALAREKLGDAPPSPPSAVSPPAPGVLHVLFVSREPLGTEPEPPTRSRRSLLSALFSREQLPFDPVPQAAPRRRSRLAALFVPEKLDESP